MEGALKGALLFAQSGGPTAVINASAAGVFTEALNTDCITAVYGSHYGVKGILDEEIYDISKESPETIEQLKYTPSSALGSVRYKLGNPEEDPREFEKILSVFRRLEVRYFIYNGGNDSMDTCDKISRYFEKSGYECRIMGVPKTIDNDLAGTDHCPGYGSAAKYIATTITELALDSKVYDTGSVLICEAMGRNAGWLTAASALAGLCGEGPDLIYLPEISFSFDRFLSDVSKVCEKKNNKCVVVVSEGIRFADGRYVGEFGIEETDRFGHAQMGGVCNILKRLVKEKLGVKVRAIEFSLMQRCAAHLASGTDIEEAFGAGAAAVRYAAGGETGKMVTLERVSDEAYRVAYGVTPLSMAANHEKTVPISWINAEGNGLTEEFIAYALPLIQGETGLKKTNGLPAFVSLKKEKAAL